MNLALKWVLYLQERGHECERWSQIGDPDADDGKFIGHAASVNAVILSGDLDFAAYHALQGTSKPSVIQLRAKDMTPKNLGPLVARALTIANRELIKGAVVTIKGTRMRIAKLPIGNTDPI